MQWAVMIIPEPEIFSGRWTAKNGRRCSVGWQQRHHQTASDQIRAWHITLQIVDAPDIVEMTDKPVESARKKPNNSMAVGLNLVKEGKAEAFVTAGNTGPRIF